MELKLVSQMHLNYAQASSNCTFMELKYAMAALNFAQESSNCTFMELK